MRCVQSCGWLSVPFPTVCDLREDPASPHPDNPLIMSLLKTLGHLLFLFHLILITPLKVGDSVPIL